MLMDNLENLDKCLRFHNNTEQWLPPKLFIRVKVSNYFALKLNCNFYFSSYKISLSKGGHISHNNSMGASLQCPALLTSRNVIYCQDPGHMEPLVVYYQGPGLTCKEVVHYPGLSHTGSSLWGHSGPSPLI